MGRPSFAIDHTRLRALREEKGLTQAALALKIAQQLGKPETESLVRHYQRIEETGQTSISYATALAKVLGVSVPLLQGLEQPDPNAYLMHMQALLAQQLDTGENLALRELLAHHAKDNEASALQYLAEDIAEHIEQVQLVRNPTMVSDLVNLTHLSESDLLAPANVRGFWFLSVKSRIMNCSEVVDGVSSLNYRVGEVMQAYLSSHRNDSTVRMWYDRPWVRIEICRPRTRDRMLVDFTRCQPDATGLRWTAPSWRDEFFLELSLNSHAFANADVVTDFTGRTAPADYGRLRLVVDEHDRNDGKPLRRMVVDGGIGDMPESVKENFARESSTRVLFMNWLTNDLRTALMPHLVTEHTSGWHVRVNGCAVDISRKDARNRGIIYADLRYRIVLAEETGTDEFSTVPVREKDLDELRQHIEDWLRAGDTASTCADERPTFATI
ncbi:MAG: XRE family transcriptional regulator [Oxalobacteraceae bacterium]|nr:MAG: XRE family transcriptional regulator [Oxalobacteraceae bacterium]